MISARSIKSRGSTAESKRAWSAIVIVVTSFCLLGIVAFQDLVTPAAVHWQPFTVAGKDASRAPSLILQHEKDGVLWASDGFSIYRSLGDEGFEKVHTVRPPLGKVWAAKSRFLRNWFDVQEIIEVFPLRSDLLIVFVGGEIHRIDLATGEEQVVHRLRYFGTGEGRGLMPFGITVDEDGRLYYGEYVTRRLQEGETVALFRSDDDGRNWQIVFEFPAITVRHIHAIQWDPYGKAIWMGTGDGDEQSRIGYSTDQGQTFTWIGMDSQDFRTVNFVFSEKSVDWLSDTMEIPPRALRWDRRSWAITISEQTLPGHGLYLQAIGDGYSLATTSEENASLWLLAPDQSLQKIVGWAPEREDPGAPASLRLARGGEQSNDRWLYFSPLRTDAEEAAIYRIPRETALAGIR